MSQEREHHHNKENAEKAEGVVVGVQHVMAK